mmetsp:Transcript_1/g.2  ORF Transcript_1/g.2 Transcript_1/m.2 type:complete len:232 (-) Transcript_1:57-752(-)
MSADVATQPAGDAMTDGAVESMDPRVPALSKLPPLPTAPELLFGDSTADKKLYWDRSHYSSPEAQMEALQKSSTLYIGNMSFSTRSLQLRAHFRQIGPVKAVHMGLDRFRKTPCGFAFVEYYYRRDALEAVASLSGTKLDGRVIRVELDAGYQKGRELGRGASGGQVRDDRRRGGPRQHNRGSGGGPPNRQNNNDNNNTSYYGNAGGGQNQQQQDGFNDMGEEKNPRFREE